MTVGLDPRSPLPDRPFCIRRLSVAAPRNHVKDNPMSKDDHKIDADDRNVFQVLNEQKYTDRKSVV